MATRMPITTEQFSTIVDSARRYDLIEGDVRSTAPATAKHGVAADKLAHAIGNDVEDHALDSSRV